MEDSIKSKMVLHQTDVRPWGEYEVLLDSDACKVKKITVAPGQRLSYQYHENRREQWVVVKGQLTVVLNGRDVVLNPGMTLSIHIGDKHRAWNKTDSPVEFIEVQTGTYFGEDDIIRIEDDYGRQD